MLMSVPSFIRIERGLDGGPLLHIQQDASSCSKIIEYQCFAVCCPKTSSCSSNPSKLLCKLVIRQFLFQVPLGWKEVQMGAHDFKLNIVPLFARKPGNSMFRGLLHRNKLLCQQAVLLRCQLVNSQCLCKVSLGLKNV